MWMGIRNLWRPATFRLALFFAFAVTAAISLVLALIYWQVVLRDTAHQNHVLVGEVAKVVDQPRPQLERELDLRLTMDLRRLDFAALYGSNGKLISGNLSSLPPQLPIDGAAHVVPLPAEAHNGAIEPVLVVAQRRQDGGVLLLGRNLYDVYAFRKIVLESLALGIAPAMLLALIIGTLFSLRAARRLQTINQQIMRIMQGDLNERLPTHGSRDDLDHVAGGVNLMLDEIVRLLDQIKSVGDNIAHDLRTPLAVVRARLERGLESESAEDLRGAADLALVDLDRALTTVTALLRISDIEYGRRTSSFDEVDLKDVCVNAFELFQPLAEAKSIAFTLDAPAPLRIVGDFDLLVEAVGNLVDNAIKFTPAGGSVKIVATMAASQPAVRVCDSGPGVAPFERSSIFKRFYRSAQTRHLPGTGLGLNMAATIARLHGFDLLVADNHPGAVFELSPLARPAPSPSGAKQTDQADWSSKIAGEQIRIEV
jgi:signal transduction histidine kinase